MWVNILSLIFFAIQISSTKLASKQISLTNPLSQCCPAVYTLTTNGMARMSMGTNTIRIGLTIETLEKKALLAFNNNNVISTKVDTILTKDFGIPKANITTSGYEMKKQYQQIYNEGNRTYTNIFEGFLVTNKLDVKVTDLKFAANLIDKLINSGVKDIDYVNFEVDPETIQNVKKNLITAAVQDAFEKANLAVMNVNMIIDNVSSISISDYSIPNYSPTNFAMDSLSRSAASPVLYGSQNDFSMNVNVVFIMKKMR